MALNFTAIPYGCSIRLLWKTLPDTSCPITRYTVLYRESMTSASNQRIWLNKSLDKPNATYYRLHLDCNKNYEVLVVAWNERGSSFVEEKSVLTVFTEEDIIILLISKCESSRCCRHVRETRLMMRWLSASFS